MGVKERIARYGLRVICLACGTPGRHFPGKGRLRDQSCRFCNVPGFVVSWAWVCRYPTKAEQKRKMATDVARAIA